jgi:hypothetical protein
MLNLESTVQGVDPLLSLNRVVSDTMFQTKAILRLPTFIELSPSDENNLIK